MNSPLDICEWVLVSSESAWLANPSELRIRITDVRGSAYGRAIRPISRSLVNHCRIRANPLGLRIRANCESASQVGMACNASGVGALVYTDAVGGSHVLISPAQDRQAPSLCEMHIYLPTYAAHARVTVAFQKAFLHVAVRLGFKAFGLTDLGFQGLG